MKIKGSLKNFILRNYLFIIIVPAILILLTASMVLIKYCSFSVMKDNRVISENISKNLNTYLNQPLDILKYADSSIEKGGDKGNTIRSILSSNNVFKKIEILNKNGSLTNSFPNGSSVQGADRSKEDYYKAALAKSVYWSRYINSKNSADPEILLEYPGNKYILLGYLNLKDILNSYKDLIKDGIEISIIDKDGIYISNNNTDFINKSADENLIKNIKNKTGNNNSFIYKDKAGRKVLLSYTPVKLTGWYIIVNQPYYTAIKPVFIIIIGIIAGLILTIAAITLFLYFRAAIIEKSFNNLSCQTSLVAKDECEKMIVMDSFTEFNNLVDNINQMIAKIKKRDQRLREMAYYDSLTGLPNRTYLNQELEKYIKICSKNSKSFGLLYIDIDDFRRINDTYGHKAGDEVLIQFSKRLNHQQENNISCFRLGDDEFALLIQDVQGRIELESDVKHLINKFKNPFIYEEKEIYFSVSVGITIYPKDGEEKSELLQYADTAMYSAKEKGKNNYKFFTGRMRDEAKKKLDIERNLRRALSKNEFLLYYQPQIDINNLSIKGFEALIRWNSREMGFINPTEFISICEETNMIIPISNWIVEEACKTIKKINRKYEKNYTISINISPIQLQYENFIIELKDIINKTGVNPEFIELEITENVLINSYNEILDILYKIKEIGVKISLDDFGTGYSSFSYLKNLPIDFLKIDKAFVNNIDKDNKDLKLIRSIINMAHDLNMKVIAEGIETFSQLNYIEKNNCDIVQGYVYSKPIPEDLLDDYIIKYNEEDISPKLIKTC
ncbi:MAG: EAL domain-containing protein [Bacillota bacterium]|nr:EAL domain-containing protein [Bacillota bacterium]